MKIDLADNGYAFIPGTAEPAPAITRITANKTDTGKIKVSFGDKFGDEASIFIDADGWRQVCQMVMNVAR